MAPRRVVLLLLVAAAAACSGLISSPAVVHAARDLPPHHDDDVIPVAETTTGFQPTTIDADGALRCVLPHVIHPTVLADNANANATDDPAVQRTVYDVTVVFRATARLGPPRLQYYVVPADASVTISGGSDYSTKTVGQILLFLDLLLCVFIVDMKACSGGGGGDESSLDGAIPKNPEVALAQVAGAAKARRGY